MNDVPVGPKKAQNKVWVVNCTYEGQNFQLETSIVEVFDSKGKAYKNAQERFEENLNEMHFGEDPEEREDPGKFWENTDEEPFWEVEEWNVL